MAADCDQAHRRAFDNAHESLARCTSLMQSAATCIDTDQRLLCILEGGLLFHNRSLSFGKSHQYFLYLASFFLFQNTDIYILGTSAAPDSFTESPPSGSRAGQD